MRLAQLTAGRREDHQSAVENLIEKIEHKVQCEADEISDLKDDANGLKVTFRLKKLATGIVQSFVTLRPDPDSDSGLEGRLPKWRIGKMREGDIGPIAYLNFVQDIREL